MPQTLDKRIFSMGSLAIFFGLSLAFALPQAAHAVSERDAQKLVDSSYYAYMDLIDGDNSKTMNTLLKEARGVMIFPSVGKGGFVIGAEGGKGILLARGTDGSWSYPAFYGMRSLSFGLQAGYQETRILLIIMNDSALTSILEGKLKLGADASIVLINEGVDGELSTNNARQDIYYYAQTESGLFAGISIEGSDIFTRKKHNKAYYEGKPTPADIVIRRKVSNPNADRLRANLP
jgi:SH3 domain-containing YSC84-like protein 1